MRGRKPKPAYLRVLDGNAGHRPGNPEAPRPVGDLLEPPSELTLSQQRIWREAIEAAPPGMLKKLDQSVFRHWVLAVDYVEQLRGKIATLGMIIKGPNGSAIVNPLLREMRGQAALARQHASEMGFSPTARQRVKVPKSDQGKADPFADLKSLDD